MTTIAFSFSRLTRGSLLRTSTLARGLSARHPVWGVSSPTAATVLRGLSTASQLGPSSAKLNLDDFRGPMIDDGTSSLKRAGLFMLGYYSKSSTMLRSSHHLYMKMIAHAKCEEMYKAFDIEHDAASEFAIRTALTWILFQRLRIAEDKLAGDMSQHLFDLFWEDQEKWLVQQGYHTLSLSRHAKDMQSVFFGLAMALDDGLYGDDATMAAALWRNMSAPSASATSFAKMTAYIRENIAVLDKVSDEELIYRGNVDFVDPANISDD